MHSKEEFAQEKELNFVSHAMLRRDTTNVPMGLSALSFTH